MSQSLVRQWFVLYQHDVYHFLVYYLGRTDVEDLVQEVFLTCLKQKNLQDVEHPKAWLLTIARNKAISQTRRQKLLSWLPDSVIDHLPSNVKSPEDNLGLKEELENVYRQISHLKKNYRDVIILRLIQDLSVEETSIVLQWSPEKVSLTYHRAMKKLQALIRENEQVEGRENPHEQPTTKQA